LIYDDSVQDLDSDDTGFGAYFTEAAPWDLTIVAGNFFFSPGSDVGDLGIGVENDNDLGEDWTYISATDYTTSGPFPAGVGTGLPAYADFTFTDYSGTAHGSDALMGLNWNLSGYDDAFVHLFAAVTGRDEFDYVDLQGTITGIQILPEPSMTLLCASAVAALALAHRRG
jgi:hypothetical protein